MWARGWEAIVDARSYPVLAKVLGSEQGAQARAELERLLGHFWQDRAERHRCQVQAKLFLPASGTDPITVQTLDISASGIQVCVPFGNEIDVMTAGGIQVILRADTDSGPRMIRLPATLVRVAGIDDDGVRVGLHFDGPTQEQSRLITSLVDVP